MFKCNLNALYQWKSNIITSSKSAAKTSLPLELLDVRLHAINATIDRSSGSFVYPLMFEVSSEIECSHHTDTHNSKRHQIKLLQWHSMGLSCWYIALSYLLCVWMGKKPPSSSDWLSRDAISHTIQYRNTLLLPSIKFIARIVCHASVTWENYFDLWK